MSNREADELSDRQTDSSPESSPQPQPNGWQGAIARFFNFEENRTNLRTEVLAGVTTFMTMAYILAVNPGILSNAIFLQQPQDLFGELVIATAISSAIASLLMGLVSNYPFAMAPGMGLNAFFTFSIVKGLGINWRVALTAVLLEGLLTIALTVSNLMSAGVARYTRRVNGWGMPTNNKLSVANPYSGAACCSTYFFSCSTVTPPQLATKYEPVQNTGFW
jgi:hypothetical protein